MRRLTFVGITLLGILAGSGTAVAHRGPAATFTDNAIGVTETFPELNPCTGAPGMVTVTYNGVFHVTEFADGHYRVNGTQTGTFVFDTNDPALADYAGRFTNSFSESSRLNGFNGTFTFTVRGSGTDGSRIAFHQTSHITVVDSDVIVQFDKIRCG